MATAHSCRMHQNWCPAADSIPSDHSMHMQPINKYDPTSNPDPLTPLGWRPSGSATRASSRTRHEIKELHKLLGPVELKLEHGRLEQAERQVQRAADERAVRPLVFLPLDRERRAGPDCVVYSTAGSSLQRRQRLHFPFAEQEVNGDAYLPD